MPPKPPPTTTTRWRAGALMSGAPWFVGQDVPASAPRPLRNARCHRCGHVLQLVTLGLRDHQTHEDKRQQRKGGVYAVGQSEAGILERGKTRGDRPVGDPLRG